MSQPRCVSYIKSDEVGGRSVTLARWSEGRREWYAVAVPVLDAWAARATRRAS